MPWRRLEDRPDESQGLAKRKGKRARFLVDESLGKGVADLLKTKGWNVRFVPDCGLAGHSDEDVLAFAYREDRVLLTHDHDFLSDRAFPPHRNPGIVVLPGGDGHENALVNALAEALGVVGPLREEHRGTKVFIDKEGVWTVTRRDPSTGGMERIRLKPTPNGAMIWTD